MKDYNKFPQRLATPEEKHWLEACIAANSFMSYEEAMKTFVTEYYEYINNEDTSWKLGKIYKLNENKKINFESGKECTFGNYYTDTHLFKPSTKEAYDAQFIVKEQLEEPKDKVLEKEGIDLNIGKIIRVESSEGAIYQLGDKITVFTKDSQNKGRVLTIKGFRWNNAKTNICAITELHTPNGIGLDKIELYSEPKQIVEDFKLPETWWVRITEENLEDVSKFLGFKPNEKAIGYITGMVKRYRTGKIEKGWNATPTTIYGSTFGEEITTEQFRKYVLNEKI